jgi:hypothetical protein
MTSQDQRHYDAILQSLRLRDYCAEHGLNLHEVMTDAWFNWCERKIAERLANAD